MANDLSRLVKELSRADIESLLATKNEMETLELRRQELQKELADVEQRLGRLADRTAGSGKLSGARSSKKSMKKAAKKTAKKTVKKTTKKATSKASKKTASEAGKAPAARRGRGRATGSGNTTLEDVVVQVLTTNGEPMSFKDLLATITDRKLFKSRSKSFDNVLRRTLSTSKKVKRVGRGIYGL
jgi:cell division septum initiation protein DivIVA